MYTGNVAKIKKKKNVFFKKRFKQEIEYRVKEKYDNAIANVCIFVFFLFYFYFEM